MAGIISRGAFPNELDKSLDMRFCEANASVMTQWGMVFKEIPPARGKSRYTSALSGLKDFEVVPEGGVPTMDIPVEGWEKETLFVKYGRAYQITEEMIQDQLDENMMQMAASLGNQAEVKVNTVAFAFLEGGFGTYTTADGQYLFDTDHTLLNTGTTTYSNDASAALSEASLQAAFEQMDKLKDHSGNPAPQKLQKVLVSPDDRFTVAKLWGGDRILGSADNDPLTTNPSFGVMSGWNFEVIYYLTDTNNWYALGDKADLNISFKKKADQRYVDDKATGGRIYYCTERFQVFAEDWRGLYGSEVS